MNPKQKFVIAGLAVLIVVVAVVGITGQLSKPSRPMSTVPGPVPGDGVYWVPVREYDRKADEAELKALEALNRKYDRWDPK